MILITLFRLAILTRRPTPSIKPRCVVIGTRSVNAAMVAHANLLMARKSFVLSPAMDSGRLRLAWLGCMVVAPTEAAAATPVSIHVLYFCV